MNLRNMAMNRPTSPSLRDWTGNSGVTFVLVSSSAAKVSDLRFGLSGDVTAATSSRATFFKKSFDLRPLPAPLPRYLGVENSSAIVPCACYSLPLRSVVRRSKANDEDAQSRV